MSLLFPRMAMKTGIWRFGRHNKCFDPQSLQDVVVARLLVYHSKV